MTLNETLQELDYRGIKHSKIGSGYFIPDHDGYLLCKCDGDTELVSAKCDCGRELYVCNSCLESGSIGECPRCHGRRLSLVSFMKDQFREQRKKQLNLTDEELDKLEREMLGDDSE